jgi:hypothetical protein
MRTVRWEAAMEPSRRCSGAGGERAAKTRTPDKWRFCMGGR